MHVSVLECIYSNQERNLINTTNFIAFMFLSVYSSKYVFKTYVNHQLLTAVHLSIWCRLNLYVLFMLGIALNALGYCNVYFFIFSAKKNLLPINCRFPQHCVFLLGCYMLYTYIGCRVDDFQCDVITWRWYFVIIEHLC